MLSDPTPPRRRVLSPLETRWLREACDQWRDQGAIVSGFAPWAANPVFVQKKNGAIRVCADYRPINKVLESFDWPMPRISDIRHWVKGYTWFARIDQKNAFHRITVDPEHQPLTAMWTPWGCMYFTVMEFGLKTAPAYFQRFMDHTLRDEADALPYMDDTLVRARTKAELRTRVRRVLARLRKAGANVNWEKSDLCSQHLDFCGLVVTPSGIDPAPTITELNKIPCPYTKKDRQSALGLVNYFREHLVGLHHITPLLQPDQHNIAKSADYEADWRELMRRVSHHVSLTHHDSSQPSTLFTDASKYGTGAVLVQNGKVVAMSAKTLTRSQANYSTTDREQLGLVHAAERFKVYLMGDAPVIMATDHTALLNRTKELTPRQERWRVTILNWVRNLRYEPGLTNPADFLSRRGLRLARAPGDWGIKDEEIPLSLDVPR
jgi:hypothetical protein